MSLALDIFSLAAIGAGAFFFFAGTVGLLRFPNSAHPPACADQGGQSRSRPDRARASASRGKPARCAETDRHLGPHPIVRRSDGATDRARAQPSRERPSERASGSRSRSCDPCSGGRLLDHRRARGLQRSGRLCRLRASALDCLDPALCAGRGPDRGGDWQRRDRRPPGHVGRAPQGRRRRRGRRAAGGL